jgi:competence protein ComEA
MGAIGRRSLWGWDLRVRRLLATSALIPALALAWPTAERTAPVVEPVLVVDPNTAPAGVLLALPRVGPVLAGRIVAARRERPFRSLDEVDARVRGIGPVIASALRPHLRFPGAEAETAAQGRPVSEPVDPGRADSGLRIPDPR